MRHIGTGIFSVISLARSINPGQFVSKPTNLISLFNQLSAEALEQVDLSDPPHHALLDARMLAELFKVLASRLVLSP